MPLVGAPRAARIPPGHKPPRFAAVSCGTPPPAKVLGDICLRQMLSHLRNATALEIVEHET